MRVDEAACNQQQETVVRLVTENKVSIIVNWQDRRLRVLEITCIDLLWTETCFLKQRVYIIPNQRPSTWYHIPNPRAYENSWRYPSDQLQRRGPSALLL